MTTTTTKTSDGYTVLFERGQGRDVYKIEENPEGLLCVTDRNSTRLVIAPESYRGWDATDLWMGLRSRGLSERLMSRYLKQAGL